MRTAGQYFLLVGVFSSMTCVAANGHNDFQVKAAESVKLSIMSSKQDEHFIIAKASWDEQDEQEFSEFIAKLGASNCSTFDECLKSKANPYRFSDPDNLDGFSDCADLPYMLRSYFAWKRGLPFSIVSGVESKDPPPVDGASVDLRATVNGNRITDRTDFTAQPVKDASGAIRGAVHYTIRDMWDMINNRVASSTYRTDPRDENSKNFSDFYPVLLDRKVVRPGTIVYNSDGHVAVVYNVASNGDVQVMQASTDGSVSRIVFNKNSFPQSRTEHGWGFRNWRPQSIVAANKKLITDANGSTYNVFLGGRIVGNSDDELRHEGKYSMEQYGHQHWKYDYNGQRLDWDDYVTARLSGQKWVRDPLRDFNKRMLALCVQAQNRVKAVDLAVARGLPREAHPLTMPENIYSSQGQPDWEAFSTPARDADLRSMMADLTAFSRDLLLMSAEDLRKTSYSGNDLAADLRHEYARQSAECKIEYQNSVGKMIPLTLAEVISRADRLSFDPYHCPELRWGARGNEARTCAQSPESNDWYRVQAPLRTQRNRDTRGFYGYSLNEASAAFATMGEKANFDLASVF